jgi:hypothetical protein
MDENVTNSARDVPEGIPAEPVKRGRRPNARPFHIRFESGDVLRDGQPRREGIRLISGAPTLRLSLVAERRSRFARG